MAFCFDQAVGHFGRVVSNELEAVEGKNEAEILAKRKLILAKYLGPISGKSGFADPAAMVAKR